MVPIGFRAEESISGKRGKGGAFLLSLNGEKKGRKTTNFPFVDKGKEKRTETPSGTPRHSRNQKKKKKRKKKKKKKKKDFPPSPNRKREERRSIELNRGKINQPTRHGPWEKGGVSSTEGREPPLWRGFHYGEKGDQRV